MGFIPKNFTIINEKNDYSLQEYSINIALSLGQLKFY